MTDVTEVRLERIGNVRLDAKFLDSLLPGKEELTAKDLIDSLSEQEKNELASLMNGSYRFVLDFDK